MNSPIFYLKILASIARVENLLAIYQNLGWNNINKHFEEVL